MIAKFHLLLPFSLQVPEGEKFKVFSYEENGYRVSVYPPAQSEVPAGVATPDKTLMNGRPYISCNALRFDFHKEEFDCLLENELDPPLDFMANTVNSFLSRLRYVTRAFRVRPVDFKNIPWKLRYLNDD